MKKLLAITTCCVAGTSVFALPDYDPFADATGAGGTSYTIGANLAGQTNATGVGWYTAGPGTGTIPSIVAGDLTVSGLYTAGGGAGAGFGGNGTSARMNAFATAQTSGTIYYSFAMQLTSVGALNSGGIFWAGLNNSLGSQSTTPSTVGTRIVTRTAGSGLYNVGLDKASGATASFVWAAGNFTTSSQVFVVGSYTFNTSSTTDDLSSLWVNPSSATFGDASAPAATLTSTAGTDIPSVASFVLFNRSTAEPTAGEIDDLRIGTSWADVTPVVPEPATITIGALGAVGLGLALRRRLARK